jgi:hypothetical protein
MEDLLGLLQEKIESRTETYDCRSEKWQESEKGEEYQELTDRLQEMEDEVGDWINELSEY